MLLYILKRSAYSILVILGVMLVTFLLFRVAAGDPAATLLGKNPSPKEIEDLRMELSSNKPVVWGYWRRTELFTSAEFDKPRQVPGITVKGKGIYQDGSVQIPEGSELSFSRNFKLPDVTARAVLTLKGELKCNDRNLRLDDWEDVELVFDSAVPSSLDLSPAGNGFAIKRAVFYRKQASPWDSQLVAAFAEIVQLRSSFPYISFFNFGRTLVTRENIREVLWRGMWPSLFLMVPIFVGELLLGLALAMVATVNMGRWLDRVLVIVSITGMSVSYLVFIIFGQWYLGYYFNLFPVWGYGDLRHLILPIGIGILSGIGGGVRFYRTVFVNELNREYLRTAKAKGCDSWMIYMKHLFKNALIPIITRATSIIPFLFTGSLLLERFFGIPGLGYAGIEALQNSDLQMIKALVIVGAFIFVVVNLLADIAYTWADPRIRLS